MKKKVITITYFVFLSVLFFAIGYVLFFDLRDAIKAGENPFCISIPWVARRIFFEGLAFVSVLVVFLISILFKDRENSLKTAEERQRERKARRNEKILQLNAKIEKLKKKDDE